MMMLVLVTLSTDVSRSVIINMIIVGANCVACIWCALVLMCCYDSGIVGHLLLKRKAKVLVCGMTTCKNYAWGPQGPKLDSGLGDSVKEMACQFEGMPSRAQTVREGKPSCVPEWARRCPGELRTSRPAHYGTDGLQNGH